jgi:hypothetical protein
MNRAAALKSYEAGWKRSREYWRTWNELEQARKDAEWERERAIIAAEREKALARLA